MTDKIDQPEQPMSAREFLIGGGGWFEDGEDGIRSCTMSAEHAIELMDEFTASLRQQLAAKDKYEALYADAREELCSCNHTGDKFHYTCDWCKRHPSGAEPPPIIQQLWDAESDLAAAKLVNDEMRRQLQDSERENAELRKALISS